jgi:hypothetical protein
MTHVSQHAVATTAPFITDDNNDCARLAERTKNVLVNIPNSLTFQGAPFPVLRIFASWPGDSKLERTLKQRVENGKGLEDDIGDPDRHPLATLNLEHFQEFAETLQEDWLREIKS